MRGNWPPAFLCDGPSRSVKNPLLFEMRVNGKERSNVACPSPPAPLPKGARGEGRNARLRRFLKNRSPDRCVSKLFAMHLRHALLPTRARSSRRCLYGRRITVSVRSNDERRTTGMTGEIGVGRHSGGLPSAIAEMMLGSSAVLRHCAGCVFRAGCGSPSICRQKTAFQARAVVFRTVPAVGTLIALCVTVSQLPEASADG